MSESVFEYASIEKREVACPVCRGRSFRPLASRDRYGMGIVTVGCLGCGLMMTNPMPTTAALTEFYRRHYRTLYRKVDVPNPEYIREYGLDRRAQYTAGVVADKGLLQPSVRILDVGCAEGSLLQEVRRRCPGITTVGIEPGEGFAGYCRQALKLDVFPSLEALRASSPPPFDVIISIHVLEHVENPVEFLRELRPLLKPGGTVLIDVPDAAAYSSLDDLHLAHLYHFSRYTLSLAAKEAGFFVAGLDRHQPPRHPPSLRILLRQEAPASASDPLPDEREAVFDRMSAVGRKTFVYWLKHTPPGRLLAACRRGIRSLLRPSSS